MSHGKDLKIKMPEDVKGLLSELLSSGFDADIVGGCVRDALLGREPKDWDITTSATIDEMKEIFSEREILLVGEDFGTIKVKGNSGEYYEVTTFRTESNYDDCRHPSDVVFVSTIEEDLARRDFTINAMAYNEVVGLVDPYDGQLDLQMGNITCVGNPNERFKEDALRILRAIRFASRYNFTITRETELAMFRHKELLQYISSERFVKEFDEIMLCNCISDILRDYDVIFFEVIPELKAMVDCKQYSRHHEFDVWEHTLHVMSHLPMFYAQGSGLELGYAALFHDIGKPITRSIEPNGEGHFYRHNVVGADIASKIMTRLHFSNERKSKVVNLIMAHTEELKCNKGYIRRLIPRIGGYEMVLELICLHKADNWGKRSNAHIEPNDKELGIICSLLQFQYVLEEVMQESAAFKITDLEINGNDLMALGVKQGPKIGEILNKLLQDVQDDKIENSHNALLKCAIQML